MTKDEKRKMKKYELTTKDEFGYYLYQLICRCYKLLKQQNRYLKLVSEYISIQQKRSVLTVPSKIDIPYEEYSNFLAMLGHVETNLLNVIGDLQDSSLSYYKFRNIISKRKKKNSLTFEIRDIEDDCIEILKNFNLNRNFQNHMPESLITTEDKMIKEQKLCPIEINPIPIISYHSCTLEFLADMYKSYTEMHKLSGIVFESMKKDMESLTGQKLNIIEVFSEKSKGIEHLEPVKLASEIQGIK